MGGMCIQIVGRDICRTRRGGGNGLPVVSVGRRLVAEQGLGKGQVHAGEMCDRVGTLEGKWVETGLEIAQIEGAGQDVDSACIPAVFLKGTQPFVGIIFAYARQQADIAIPYPQAGSGIKQIATRYVNEWTAHRGQQIIPV